VEAVYQKLINEISTHQYASLKDVLIKIAQLSELNLVYLMVTQGQNINRNQESQSSNSNSQTGTQQTNQNSTTPEKPKNPYLRRGQEYIEKNNFAKAVLELREGLKSNPNDADIHSLLGFAYIQEKQLAMGRVHVKKALQLDSRNKVALECQEILDKINPDNKQNKDTQKKSGGGLFGLFGGKK